MIVFKRGTKLPPKYLTAVLRAQHEEAQKRQADELARRAERNIPASDEKPCETCGKVPDVEPLGDFEGFEHLDGLRVVFRSLSTSEVRAYRLDMMSMVASFTDEDSDDPEVQAKRYENLKKSERHAAELKRDVAVKLIASIDGLANTDGSDLLMPAEKELSADELDLLEDNGLLDPLMSAGMYLQDLTDEARKNCGASQPSTSASTTAAPAHNTSDTAEVVTTSTGPIQAGEMTSTSTSIGSASTPPASARNGFSSETPISAPSSSSSGSSGMQV